MYGSNCACQWKYSCPKLFLMFSCIYSLACIQATTTYGPVLVRLHQTQPCLSSVQQSVDREHDSARTWIKRTYHSVNSVNVVLLHTTCMQSTVTHWRDFSALMQSCKDRWTFEIGNKRLVRGLEAVGTCSDCIGNQKLNQCLNPTGSPDTRRLYAMRSEVDTMFFYNTDFIVVT